MRICNFRRRSHALGRWGRGRCGGGQRDAEADGEDFGLEAASGAGIARLWVHEGFEAVAGEFALAFGVEAFEVGDDAFEGTADFAGIAGTPEGEFHGFRACAAEEFLFEIVGQVFPRGVETLAELGGHAAQEALVIDHHALAAAAPGQDGAFVEGFFGVGDDEALVEDHFLAESVANGTGAGRGVEGEMFGSGRLEAQSAGGTVVAVGMKGLGPGTGWRG